MAKHVDPEGLEIKEVLRYSHFAGKDVLEIGCGDGRLSFKYADKARSVVAIDPNKQSIAAAKKNLPKHLASKLTFRVGKGEELGDYVAKSFGVVLFSWSLCCADIPVMGRALDEAWRVLKRNGILVNLQPSLYQPFEQGALSYLVKKRFGTSADVENYRQSRFALKYKSLIEGMFDLVQEEEFPVKTVYDTVEDAVEDVASGAREQYESLDNEKKQYILDELKSRSTRNGIVVTENAVLTVLRKREPKRDKSNRGGRNLN